MRPVHTRTIDRAHTHTVRRTANLERRITTDMRPAQHEESWSSDASMDSGPAVLAGSGPAVLRGYALSNGHTVPVIFAFYTVEADASDDNARPKRIVKIPARLTANMDGAGVDYPTGIWVRAWATIDTASENTAWDFDGGVDITNLVTATVWWDGPNDFVPPSIII